MKKTVLKVDGMHCAACSATVERAINKLEGVDFCSVNLAGGSALVSFDNTIINIQQIITAIRNAGFKAYINVDESKTERIQKAKKLEKEAGKRLVRTVIFAVPLFYISMGHMLGLPLPDLINPSVNPSGFALIQCILALLIILSSFNIFYNAFKAAVHKRVNMDTLVSMGSLSSFIYSVYAMIHIFFDNSEYLHQLYFESSGMILSFILIGRYLESTSKRKTNSAVEKLIDLSPSTAIVSNGNTEKTVQTETLIEGDIVIVKSGMSIPVDGEIIEGNCLADESMLTGESKLVEKSAGHKVYGGTVNTNGYIKFVVEATLKESAPARIAGFVSQAQSTKAPIAKLADKIAGVFVPAVMLIAVLASSLWFFVAGESLPFALKAFVSVLVIACPCSLGLATPTALTVAMGRCASEGILIKSGDALQRLSKINMVAFDKTGTVTNGKPKVVFSTISVDFDEKDVLNYLFSAENKSEHPLAQAVTEFCISKSAEALPVNEFESVSGMGLKCNINGRSIICGNANIMSENDIKLSDFSGFNLNSLQKGSSVVFIAVDGIIAGGFALEDTVRENSETVIKQINSMNIDTVMLTGDNQNCAEDIAEKTGIKSVYAGLLPENKLDFIYKFQSEGKIVAMVGDGINDAPSLTAADVGIAIGSGTDIAIESADIVLLNNDFSAVQKAFETGRQTFKIIKQNLFWAFAYNIICIPVAAGVLHIFDGPLLSPMIAAAAMSLSSVTVVLNSLRLRKRN